MPTMKCAKTCLLEEAEGGLPTPEEGVELGEAGEATVVLLEVLLVCAVPERLVVGEGAPPPVETPELIWLD